MFLMKKEGKKMNCMPYKDRIDDYTEGKLGRDEKISFENHLRECPECTALIRLQNLSDRVIAEEKHTSPGFYLSDKIMARIENSERTDPALVRVLRPMVMTISVAAAIFVGVLIGDFSVKPEVKAIPVELTLMDDIAMESVNVLSNE